MSARLHLRAKGLYVIFGALIVLCLFPVSLRAQTTYLDVDCTGATPGAYTTIGTALLNATPGTFILVIGPCNENVSISSQSNLSLGAYYGATAALTGNITISNSTNIYIYGLNVSNPLGDGIDVFDGRSVTLDTCTSNGNAGNGLDISAMSDVTVNNAGSFDGNLRGGINASGNSFVNLNAFAGLIDISNNTGPGIWVSQANIYTLGHTTVENNTSAPGSNPGYGLELLGGAHVQFGALYGPNVISGNPSGGAWLQETAEISFFSIGQPNLIQNNGPVGVSIGAGSQATFAGLPVSGSPTVAAQITGHTDAGIDIYGNSQVYMFGPNLVQGNGSTTDSRSAAIRLDGNSEALLRGGMISGNSGPGLLALVNSSADFTGVSFSGNAKGVIISCDTSSFMVSDLVPPNTNPAAGIICRTPHALGNRQLPNFLQIPPNWSALKAAHNRYASLAVKH